LEKVQELYKDADPREELHRALQISDRAKQDRRSAAQTYAHLRSTLQSTEKLLSDLREKLERHKDVQKRLEVVKRVADVFHWQSLPKAVSNANLRLLQSDINNTLSLFKDPFVVEATDELMFQAFFPGRPGISAKQLSGGQKVVLASAFRIALDRLFDVGILFLDEPTAGLDADNVAYFHDALQVMSESLKGRKQVIVITHLHEYCDKFDAVVEL
jgi:exonuclease SbcC